MKDRSLRCCPYCASYRPAFTFCRHKVTGSPTICWNCFDKIKKRRAKANMSYKESLMSLSVVLAALANGKSIERKEHGKSNWEQIFESPDVVVRDLNISRYWYRVKPEKVLRPWEYDEVPVGSIIVVKTGDREAVIGLKSRERGATSVCLSGMTGSYYTRSLLENWTMKDGTPCGVYVEE